MPSLAQQQVAVPRMVADSTVGSEVEPPKQVRSREREFPPSLTVGVFGTRWLWSYGTPLGRLGEQY